MALDFPNNPPPVAGQTYIGENGVTYVYDGSKWVGESALGYQFDFSRLTNGQYVVQLDSSGRLIIPVNGDVLRDNVSAFEIPGAVATVSDTEPNTGDATFWFNTVDGRLYIKENGVWVDSSPALLPTPSYIYSQLENTAGNIIPDATNVYSLGSPEAQWKDLWVSNATIYLNSVPLGVDVTGNLTYDGNPLVSYVDGNLNVGGTVVSGGGAADLGNYDFSGSTLQADNPIIRANDQTLTLTLTGNPDKNWVFGTDGNLTLPSGSNINFANGASILDGVGGGNYGNAEVSSYLFNNRIQTFNSVDFMYAGGFGTYPYMGLALTDSNTLAVRVNDSSGDYTSSAIEVDRVSKATTFYGDVNLDSGNLVLPGIIQSSTNLLTLQSNIDRPDLSWTITSGNEGGIGVSILSAPQGDDQHVGEIVFSGTNGGGALVYVGDISTPFDNALNLIAYGTDTNAKISTGNGDWQWTFGNTGNLSLPSSLTMAPLSNFAPAYGTALLQNSGEMIVISTSGPGGSMQMGWSDDPSSSGNIASISFNSADSGQFTITTGDYSNTAYPWTFDKNGQVIFPDSTIQTSAWTGNINTTAGYINFTASPVAQSFTGITFSDGTNLTSAARIARYDVDGGFYISENLDVDFDGHFGGNVTIAGNLDIIGNVNFTGNINQVTGNQGEFTGDPLTGVGALYAGKAGFTAVPSTIFQTTAYVNGYIQNNFQNLHPGNQASTEWVATADNGDDLTNYLDMGIAGGGWDGTQENSVGTAALANDAYVYTVGNVDAGTGGNMIIGTIQPGKNLKVLVGGSGTGNVVATFSETGATFRDTIIGSITGSATYVTGLTSANVTTALGYTPATAADVTAANAAIVTANSAVVSYVNILNTAMAANVAAANAAIITANTAMKGYVDAQIASVPGGGGSTYSNANVVAYYTSANNFSVGSGTAAHILSNSTSAMVGNLTTILNGGLNQITTYIGNNVGWWANGFPYNIRSAGGSYLSMGGGTTSLIAGGSGTANTAFNGTTIFNAGNGAFNLFQSLNFQPGANIGVNSVGSVIGITANLTHTGSNFVTSSNVLVAGNVTVNGINGVRMPNRPAFRVYGTSSGQIVAPTTISSTHGATVDFNQGSYYNNSTGVFTAPVAGLYHAYATLRVGNNNGLNQATIVKNDSTAGANVVAFWETDTNTGTAVHFSMTGYASMVAGDTLRLKVLTGNVNLDTNDSWGVTYLG